MLRCGGYIYDAACFLSQFTGKERDSESGLDNFGARYNSSTMGRFLSPDWTDDPESVPYADPQDPQSLNLYAYVRNGPISALDVDGHDPQCVNGKDPKTGAICSVTNAVSSSDLSYLQQVVLQLNQLRNDLNQLAQSASQGLTTGANWISQPRNPGCMASWMGSGSGIGSLAGGAASVPEFGLTAPVLSPEGP